MPKQDPKDRNSLDQFAFETKGLKVSGIGRLPVIAAIAIATVMTLAFVTAVIVHISKTIGWL